MYCNCNFFQWNKTNNNEIWRTWKKEKKYANSLSKFCWLSSSALKSVHFNQFFCIQTVSDVGPYQTICCKNRLYTVDAELAEHVGYINLTWNGRVCVGVAFLFVVCMLAKPYHFGVTWPTTLRKQRCDTFLYPPIWMP